MKAIILTSLFFAAAAASSAASVARAEQLQHSSSSSADDSSLTPEERHQRTVKRAMKAMIDSPDPECEWCNDASFLFAAQDALDNCPGQLRILQSRIDQATTDLSVDQAWNLFCTGTCPANVARIDEDHQCCMGEHGAMALNIRHACSRSSSGRYCGAEMSNLNKAKCEATDSETCTAKTNCQWDATANACYFNGDSATINSMCTACNKHYFTNFFGGGIFENFEHAKQAAIYSTFCTAINGTSCYGVGAGVGFRLPDELSSSDLTNRICPNTAAGRLAKMCMRSNSARVADGIRRAGMDEWVNCPTGNQLREDACLRWREDNFRQAAAVDASAVYVCAPDASNGVCSALTAGYLTANSCVDRLLQVSNASTARCENNCPTLSTNVINNLGCCAATYGFNGFATANSNLSSVASSQVGLGLAYYNRTLEAMRGAAPGYRAVISDANFKTYKDQAAQWVRGNDGLEPVRACAGVAAGSASSMCDKRTFSRVYEFDLALSYPVMRDIKFPEYAKHSLLVDIASAIGVGASQITSISFKQGGQLVRILAKNYPSTTVSVTVAGDSDADNQACDDAVVAINRGKSMIFTTFGPELVGMAPNAYRYAYESFFIGAYAIAQTGHSPLSAGAAADAATRSTVAPGSDDENNTNMAYSAQLAVAGVVAAISTLMMI